jgi:hypothetical protein
LELSAYRSYFTGTDDFKDGKFFNSLDRDSQSILMGCAIIICAVNAINQAKQNCVSELESHALLASDNPIIYSKILEPLIKYSQEEKDPHGANKILLMNASFPKFYVDNFGVFKNVSAILAVSIVENIRKNTPPSEYEEKLKVNNPFLLASSLSVFIEFLNGMAINYKKNYHTTPAKLIRNEALCLATSALVYSAYNTFKVDVPKGHDFNDEEKNLFARSYLIVKFANTFLGLMLVMPKNYIQDGYNIIDKKLDKISTDVFLRVVNGLSKAYSALSGACLGAFKFEDKKVRDKGALKGPDSAQRELFLKYVKGIEGLSPIILPQSSPQKAEISSTLVTSANNKSISQ